MMLLWLQSCMTIFSPGFSFGSWAARFTRRVTTTRKPSGALTRAAVLIDVNSRISGYLRSWTASLSWSEAVVTLNDFHGYRGFGGSPFGL